VIRPFILSIRYLAAQASRVFGIYSQDSDRDIRSVSHRPKSMVRQHPAAYAEPGRLDTGDAPTLRRKGQGGKGWWASIGL
jgi:hypothetical protein